VATKKQSRPLYEVFLERVIRIDAVQRHRAAVTDDHTAEFFSEGCRPGALGDFLWSLDAPEAFPMTWLLGERAKKSVSLPMQHAWDAAVAAWKGFIAALVNGELIANGVYLASGVRCEIEPAEWTRSGLILDVRDGDLIEGRHGKFTVRWSAIVVRGAIQEQKLGRIDWDAEWNEEVARREQGQLPNPKGYLREFENRLEERYGVTNVDGGDLRRFKAALYRGDLVRPRKR
jgi:hypothetical protein